MEAVIVFTVCEISARYRHHRRIGLPEGLSVSYLSGVFKSGSPGEGCKKQIRKSASGASGVMKFVRESHDTGPACLETALSLANDQAADGVPGTERADDADITTGKILVVKVKGND